MCRIVSSNTLGWSANLAKRESPSLTLVGFIGSDGCRLIASFVKRCRSRAGVSLSSEDFLPNQLGRDGYKLTISRLTGRLLVLDQTRGSRQPILCSFL
jgi:hypothetical protein